MMQQIKNSDLSDELKALLLLEADSRKLTINLNASENYTSPLVKKIIGDHPSYDFYTFPPAGGEINGPWQFKEIPYAQKIELHINKLAKILLDCGLLDARPKGGQAAEIAILTSLTTKGDYVFYVGEKDGGHFGLNFIAQKMGVCLVPLQFDHQNYVLEIDENLKLMRKFWRTSSSSKLIMIGQSLILRQQPLDLLVEAVKNEFPEVIVSYDVSHVLGLIIGKQLINPIQQGIDLIHGSTHKTFPGPQKGIIGYSSIFKEALITQVSNAVSPGLQSNSGTSEIFALAVALEEMKMFGEEYARKVCEYARYFAKLLNKVGFKVAGEFFGFTETHQIWVEIGEEQKAWQAFGDLHLAGIRAYPAYLPFVNTWGIRLSTNAITRLGFERQEIEMIAKWIKEVLVEKVPFKKILTKVNKLMLQYPLSNVKYGFLL